MKAIRRIRSARAAILVLAATVVMAVGITSSPDLRTPLELPVGHAQTTDAFTFYDEIFEGSHTVWCLDSSTSMAQGGLFETLKAETIQAIDELSVSHQFSLVAFNDDTLAWSSVLRPAFLQYRIQAVQFVQSLVAVGGSCLEDALVQSIQMLNPVPPSIFIPGFNSKNIFVVTDGQPTCGGVDTRQTVLTSVTGSNNGNAIHVICVGNQHSAIEFCQALAGLNGGRFVYAAPDPPLPPPPPPSPPPFLRGDANGDGMVNGIVDGTFLLRHLLVPGSSEPQCFDAADADDNGLVKGLVDAIYILNFHYVPGSPFPPAPGPFHCGIDPTSDELFCELGPECP